MSAVISVLGAIFAFFIVVLVHEFGHFFVARLLGIKVMQFSIGFGKALYSHTAKSGVLYAIRLLPLGGYVQMADGSVSEEELQKGSAGKPFHTRPILSRIAVVIAGPVINILLAILLYWALFIVGIEQLKPIVGRVLPDSPAALAGISANDQIKQVGTWKTHTWPAVLMGLIMHVGDKDPLVLQVTPEKSQKLSAKEIDLANWRLESGNPDLMKGLGIVPKHPMMKPIIESILPDSPAQGHLQKGDIIVAFNGQHVSSWSDMVMRIQAHPGQSVQLTVKRDQRLVKVLVTMAERKYGEQKVGYLGVTPVFPKIPPDLKSTLKYSFFGALKPAFTQTWRLIVFHFVVVKQMIVGNVSLKTLGGPITVFQSAGIASKAGLETYISFLALISIVLGVLNILPIPGLDGGHLLFCLIEGGIRRPLSEATQKSITVIGIAFLMTLMVYATINDLLRLLF